MSDPSGPLTRGMADVGGDLRDHGGVFAGKIFKSDR
jgi:hypothetical protein